MTNARLTQENGSAATRPRTMTSRNPPFVHGSSETNRARSSQKPSRFTDHELDVQITGMKEVVTLSIQALRLIVDSPRSSLAEHPKDQDRQDAGVAQNRPQKQASAEHSIPNATTNATTGGETPARSDEILLRVIKSWPRLTAVRQQMIVTIIETSA